MPPQYQAQRIDKMKIVHGNQKREKIGIADFGDSWNGYFKHACWACHIRKAKVRRLGFVFRVLCIAMSVKTKAEIVDNLRTEIMGVVECKIVGSALFIHAKSG